MSLKRLILKKSTNEHNQCPACHQDMRTNPHDGLNGDDCEWCGQGIKWREAAQKARRNR